MFEKRITFFEYPLKIKALSCSEDFHSKLRRKVHVESFFLLATIIQTLKVPFRASCFCNINNPIINY